MAAVALVASPLGGMAGLAGYHTSVLVAGEEYSFSDGGISVCRGPESHRAPGLQGYETFELGFTRKSGRELLAALRAHFEPGSYDLFRKNCNSFSDCALFFLLGVRLDARYCTLEQFGLHASGLLQAASQGQYRPNPRAAGFDAHALMRTLGPGPPVGGPGGGSHGAFASGAALGSLHRTRAASGPGGGGAEDREAAGRDPSAPPATFRPAEAFGNIATGVARMFEDIASELSQRQGHATSQVRQDHAMALQIQEEERRELARSRVTDQGPSVAQRPGQGAEARQLPRGSSGFPLENLARGVAGLFSEIVSEVGQFQQEQRRRQSASAMGERPREAPAEDPAPHLPGSPPPPPAAPEGVNERYPPRDPVEDLQLLVGMVAQNAGRVVQNLGPAFEQLGRHLGTAVEGGLGALNGAVANARASGDGSFIEERTAVVEYHRRSGAGPEQCSVCLDTYEEAQQLRILPCLHKFHKGCIDRWFGSGQTQCPVCKFSIGSSQHVG